MGVPYRGGIWGCPPELRVDVGGQPVLQLPVCQQRADAGHVDGLVQQLLVWLVLPERAHLVAAVRRRR